MQSADALVKSVLHDGDELVRQTAHKVLTKHPKATDKNFTLQQETEIIRSAGPAQAHVWTREHDDGPAIDGVEASDLVADGKPVRLQFLSTETSV